MGLAALLSVSIDKSGRLSDRSGANWALYLYVESGGSE